VDEAMRVIGQHGFNGFTIQVLAARCGLSNAGLLYYFGSKDALLIALLEEVERQDTNVIAPLVASLKHSAGNSGDSLFKRLALLRTIVKRFAERRELGRFTSILQTEAIDPLHPAHHWFRQRRDATLQLFEDMLTGLVSNPEIVSGLLFALMNGLMLEWLRADRGFDLLTVWDEGVRRLVPLDAVET
jgi:AcrR family transcriptional regulator